MTLDVSVLTGLPPLPTQDRHRDSSYVVVVADAAEHRAYRRLRHEVFVSEQELFDGTDTDAVDEDPRTIILIARTHDGEVLGGVRIHPAVGPDGVPPPHDLGWWRGSRLAVAADARLHLGVGAALIRAACARAEAEGALRFDAEIQAQHRRLFERLGWNVQTERLLHGRPHLVVDFPITRIQRLADATKAPLGGLLAELAAGVPLGFLGDDASPVPGSDLVAACDAILPAMVERDPEWAGWCSVLVNLNDLAAMGATPVGLLDAVGARDASFAQRMLRGLADAARAWGVPVLGGHTQLGVPGQLAVTAIGRAEVPIPGGGGRAGHRLRLTADLGGGWRHGYTGAQWDSTSHRAPEQLRSQARVVPALAPSAAKDVSMSGLVGSTGMLAEASGCRAILDVALIPTPVGASTADWLTCFPGFAIVSAETLPAVTDDLPTHLTSAVCGELVPGTGVGLRWPDGTVTDAITHTVTGLGTAS